MQASNDQLTSTIFKLHIEDFSKILKFIAAVLFAYFGIGIILDFYSLIQSDFSSDDYIKLVLWTFKQLVNMLGIITAIFCIIAVRLQSRGSSLNFSKMIAIFSQIYLLYLIVDICVNFENIQDKLNKEYDMTLVDCIYAIACSLLILGFLLKFFIGKAKQYHTIVTQAILENTKHALKNIEGPLNFTT